MTEPTDPVDTQAPTTRGTRPVGDQPDGEDGRHGPPGRHLHLRLLRRRPKLLRAGGLSALLAVVGPGVLAGLSDDDPAGITTYSVLGAEFGYGMLWVLTLSVAALIVFHLVGARMGVVTGKGLMTLVRERFGARGACWLLVALVTANLGTLCAEFAGVAAAAELLTGVPPYVSVPIAAAAVLALVLDGSFRRVEHVLLMLSSVFVAYVLSGLLADPDWGEAAKGLVMPSLPDGRQAMLAAVATLGTTLAPWGLAFIQSYAVNKRLNVNDLRYEAIDVVTGAVMTGVIGLFVVVACAATLHTTGTKIDSAGDAAIALEPLAGGFASTLFGLGLLGAALLAAAIVPLSTAYSVSEAVGASADINDSFRQAPVLYASFVVAVSLAAGVVLVPGVPLISILFLSQALNTVLLLPILVFVRRLALDRSVMGVYAMGRLGRAITAVTLLATTASVISLGVLTVV